MHRSFNLNSFNSLKELAFHLELPVNCFRSRAPMSHMAMGVQRYGSRRVQLTGGKGEL